MGGSDDCSGGPARGRAAAPVGHLRPESCRRCVDSVPNLLFLKAVQAQLARRGIYHMDNAFHCPTSESKVKKAGS